MNDKSLQDVEAVGEAIKRAVKKSGSKRKFAAVAVPSAMVITKVIQMPSGLKDSELEAQIQLEADQYIPYSLDEVNLDHQVIGPSEESGSDACSSLPRAARTLRNEPLLVRLVD